MTIGLRDCGRSRVSGKPSRVDPQMNCSLRHQYQHTRVSWLSGTGLHTTGPNCTVALPAADMTADSRARRERTPVNGRGAGPPVVEKCSAPFDRPART